MKKGLLIISSFLFTMAFGFAGFSYFPQHVCKKMEKEVRRAFGQEVVYSSVATPDSLRVNHEIYMVEKNDTVSGYVMVTRALGCQMGGCEKPKTDSLGFEQFFFMTAFDKNKHIMEVRILEYTSNHGYEIANKSWLKQFAKKERFEVGKNVDGISGATISVTSLTTNINLQQDIIDSLR